MEQSKEKKSHKMGRPKEDLYEKYVKGKETELVEFCTNGADLKSIAAFLGCGLTTVKTLKREYPEVKRLIEEGCQVADEAVESALYRRAIGYDAEDTVTEVKVSPDGSAQTTFVRKTKKHIPGEVGAMIFWLKNRMGNKWKDKQDLDLNTLQPISITISKSDDKCQLETQQ